MRNRILLGTCLSLLLAAPTASGASIMFILDSSNSMWGQINGVAKIETAKTVLSKLVADLPPEASVGLMAYGHRDKESCTDVEVLAPVGTGQAGAITQALHDLTPRGKTPIAWSLEQSAGAFGSVADPAKAVVLISDGVETCSGDPCAAAERLVSAGIDVKVHVVGFGISEADRLQLECIAEKGKGRYFSADSVEGFTAAVTEAVEVAAAEPETIVVAQADTTPAEPKRERVFFDDFDGVDLDEHWTVNNPDPDAYLVEDGKLLIFSGRPGGFKDPAMPNLITLVDELPRGDWDAVVKFTGELSSDRDHIWFGLRKDEENFLTADVYTKYDPGSYHKDTVDLRILKTSKGEETQAVTRIFTERDSDAEYQAFIGKLLDHAAVLTLSKRGRGYSTSLSIEGVVDDQGKPVVWETSKLTSLRTPGALTLGVSLWEPGRGETLIYVDSVEILTVEE